MTSYPCSFRYWSCAWNVTVRMAVVALPAGPNRWYTRTDVWPVAGSAIEAITTHAAVRDPNVQSVFRTRPRWLQETRLVAGDAPCRRREILHRPSRERSALTGP